MVNFVIQYLLLLANIDFDVHVVMNKDGVRTCLFPQVTIAKSLFFQTEKTFPIMKEA